FDIERDDRSKPYGYCWKENAKVLTVPTLTPQQSLLLCLAEKYLKSLLPAHLMQSMEGFFEQARRNLGPDSNAQLEREWKDKVRVVATSQPLRPPPIDPGIFAAVSEALYDNHWLILDYRNIAGKYTREAQVMPLGLAQQGPCLYLVCRFRGYDDDRSLALHRILSARASMDTFARPKEFDLEKYDAEGRFGFGDGRRIRLSFCIDRETGLHLTESLLSADQQVTERADDRLQISATVVDSLMLKWWLRSFGEAVSEICRDGEEIELEALGG
ncbi:MAG: WYL domain-containing protein, partial [Zoogloeaceae bacterium]|nr:WYL domain-containing protein [Zoogloeaceae bacterium]